MRERENTHQQTLLNNLWTKINFIPSSFFHARNFLYSLDFEYKTVKEKFFFLF